jgi:hypothetical protein
MAATPGRTSAAGLARAVRNALRDLADPSKAPGMQAYMRSEMPYRGVQAPQLRRAVKALFAAHPLVSFTDWRDCLLDLWRGARYREGNLSRCRDGFERMVRDRDEARANHTVRQA